VASGPPCATGKCSTTSTAADRTRALRLLRQTALAVVLGAALTACSDGTDPLAAAKDAGLAACAPGTGVFTVPPIDLTQITGWVPLGNLNPPGHTFPTDHQYLYLPFSSPTSAPPATTVVAPATMFITRARLTSYNSGRTDYSLEFSPCLEVHGELGHVTTISSALLPKLGAFDQGCTTYSPDPSTTVTACYTKPIAVAVSAGDALGTAGGAPGVLGLDFLLYDSRVTPLKFANASRWRSTSDGFDSFHVVAASDYFAEPAKSQVAAKVGSYDGKTRRTMAPTGGTIEVDVAGTARGAWFNPSQPSSPESPHLALVPDNVDPTMMVLSFGTSQPGYPSGTRLVSPTASGLVNRDPASITADGQIYCFQFSSGGVVLVQLLNSNTLRVEGRSSTTCGSPPFAFTPGTTFDYAR